MIKKEKLKKIATELTTNRDDFISAFRENLFKYVDDEEITLKDISEASGVSYSTLNSFLYGQSKNVRIDNVVKLARALNVSIDELVGAGTINDITRGNIAKCRILPDNALYLVRWYINYISALNSKNEPNKRYLNIMQLECHDCGNLYVTSNYFNIDISDISSEYRDKVFFGINMPCENYMPAYSPYDVLLIANDRLPKPTENALIRIDNRLYIVRRKMKNNIPKYYSIRDGKYRIDESEADELIGYVAATITLESINQ